MPGPPGRRREARHSIRSLQGRLPHVRRGREPGRVRYLHEGGVGRLLRHQRPRPHHQSRPREVRDHRGFHDHRARRHRFAEVTGPCFAEGRLPGKQLVPKQGLKFHQHPS